MKNKKELMRFASELIIIIGVTSFIFRYLTIPVKVDGTSMYPTMHDADTGLINATNIGREGIERFDIVVLNSDQLDKRIVKRVIGLPGETIEYIDDKLFIDGVYYAEPFLDEQYIEEAKIQYNSTLFTQDFIFKVDSDSIFVLGDNRLQSQDSRALGAFSYDSIIGKRGFIIFPFKNMKWLD
jgi:type I signal peptidase. Serine peptidase. MEROPS family S26A